MEASDDLKYNTGAKLADLGDLFSEPIHISPALSNVRVKPFPVYVLYHAYIIAFPG